MPVAIPNNVPNKPVVPRATSRRGGRSRSPVVVADGNPNSAAAAAAAAAAQALGRQWPPPGEQQDTATGAPGNSAEVFRGYGGGPEGRGGPGAGSSSNPSSSNGGGSPSKQQQGYPPHHHSQHGRGMEGNNWPPDYRSSRGGGYYGDPRGGPPTYPGRDPHHDYDRRYDRYGRPAMPPYDYHRYRGSGGGGGHHPSQHHPHHPQRVRYHQGGGRQQPLYGGASPIPKSPVVSGSKKKPEIHRAAASVFRKPPGKSSSSPSESAKRDDSDAPKLLNSSLHTPTPSFDQPLDSKVNLKADEATTPKDAGTPNASSDPLFSMRSGEGSKLGSSIDMAPSFPLLTQSFSFGGVGEHQYLSGVINADSFGIDPSDGVGVFRSPGSLSGSPVHSFVAQSHSPVFRTFSEGQPGGSFGPFRPQPPPPLPPSLPPMHLSHEPQFYLFLRKFKDAFRGCTFLLPGIQSALEESNTGSGNNNGVKEEESESDATKVTPKSSESAPTYMFGDPTRQDIAVARRRVHSSICAFGGSINPLSPNEATSDSSSSNDAKNAHKTKQRKYVESLSGRYYENESRLSWEFEENPPIVVEKSTTRNNEDEDRKNPSPTKSLSSEVSDKTETGEGDANTEVRSVMSAGNGEGSADAVSVKSGAFRDDMYCQTISSAEDASSAEKKSNSSQSKMKYRCKLCGQPKQNHRCPYQQSLARSIGIMVYPAVNAFTADEPGMIAAPLAEMNNFFDGRAETDSMTPNLAPRRHTAATVTPETMRSSRTSSPSRHSKKRMHGDMFAPQPQPQQGDLLFLDSMELQPEQFKYVSVATTSAIKKKSYSYAALPLPYAQRKRLSDNLFTLSNDVPKLTNECAQVLREAREKDMWDLAVAELMTQVIVIIHCSDRDYRFEGLRQYLLTLGIAC